MNSLLWLLASISALPMTFVISDIQKRGTVQGVPFGANIENFNSHSRHSQSPAFIHSHLNTRNRHSNLIATSNMAQTPQVHDVSQPNIGFEFQTFCNSLDTHSCKMAEYFLTNRKAILSAGNRLAKEIYIKRPVKVFIVFTDVGENALSAAVGGARYSILN